MTILLVRAVLLAATCGFLAAAVLDHEDPLAMALGFAPLAWLAIEAVWRLTDPGPISGERLDPDREARAARAGPRTR